jgi:hypothetical protein
MQPHHFENLFFVLLILIAAARLLLQFLQEAR